MIDVESYDLLATAIVLLDAQGNVQGTNTSAQELFGLPRGRLIGVFGASLFDADAMLESRFLDAVGGKYGVLRREVTIRRGESLVPANLVLVPHEGQPWSALLEISGMERHEQLDRALQLGKELRVQRESLRNLAHEIKNPLGGIRGAAQLLDGELEVGHPLHEYAGVIIAEADRLVRLIDRLVAPQGERLNMSRFNVHEVCERVYTLLKAEFAARIEIVRDYDASAPDLVGDPARLMQAVLNVARNAAQALTEGDAVDAPRLVLRTRIGHRLMLESRPVRMGIIITILDNGPGVPRELWETIFHPLVTGRANGTGLGLSLAQEFVHQHGGVIEFDSRKGQTEFRLVLPLESV